jgi:TonB family protein
LQGLVILEALINEDGRVEEVKVLRSAGHAGVLDRPAVAALKQWEYTPLLLNGRRERFFLTVTLSFTLQDRK